MDVRDLETWTAKQPFEPFVMHLTSGEIIPVNHPDAAVPGVRAVLVIYKRKNRLAGFAHVSLNQVVKIEPANGTHARKVRRRR